MVSALDILRDLELGAGNFTLDAWVYHAAAPWGSIIFGDNGVGFQWGLDHGSAGGGVNLWGPSGAGLYRALGYNTALRSEYMVSLRDRARGHDFSHYIEWRYLSDNHQWRWQ